MKGWLVLFCLGFLCSFSCDGVLQGMLYPNYVFPTPSALTRVYTPVAAVAASFPEFVVINPNNGNDAVCPVNSTWKAVLDLYSRFPHLSVLGYVYSSYGHRSTLPIMRTIDNYFQCWNVKGIFIDEVGNTIKNYTYYEQLYTYIKLKDKNATVWLNPGANVPVQFVNISDKVVIFESSYRKYLNWSPSPFVSRYPSSKFAALVLDTPLPNLMREVIDKLEKQNVGWLSVFNFGSGYAFSVPSFFADEITYLKKKIV